MLKVKKWRDFVQPPQASSDPLHLPLVLCARRVCVHVILLMAARRTSIHCFHELKKKPSSIALYLCLFCRLLRLLFTSSFYCFSYCVQFVPYGERVCCLWLARISTLYLDCCWRIERRKWQTHNHCEKTNENYDWKQQNFNENNEIVRAFKCWYSLICSLARSTGKRQKTLTFCPLSRHSTSFPQNFSWFCEKIKKNERQTCWVWCGRISVIFRLNEWRL